VKLGWIPPCMHTSFAPRSHASLVRLATSSNDSRYGFPRSSSADGPLLNAQNVHASVHTFV
jgi:hypothetical protein